jgi:hypothetical protein
MAAAALAQHLVIAGASSPVHMRENFASADLALSPAQVANLDEDDPDWEGVMAIYSGDSTLIRDVTFSDIRVDRIEEGKLTNIVAGASPRYNKAPGRGIDGVTLRNITYTGDGLPSPSIIPAFSVTSR